MFYKRMWLVAKTKEKLFVVVRFFLPLLLVPPSSLPLPLSYNFSSVSQCLSIRQVGSAEWADQLC